MLGNTGIQPASLLAKCVLWQLVNATILWIVGLIGGLPEKEADLDVKSFASTKSSPPTRLHHSEKNSWSHGLWCVPLGRSDGDRNKGMK